MASFLVTGADKTTGQDKRLMVEAEDLTAAVAKAGAEGLLTSDVMELDPTNRPAPAPVTSPPNPVARRLHRVSSCGKCFAVIGLIAWLYVSYSHGEDDLSKWRNWYRKDEFNHKAKFDPQFQSVAASDFPKPLSEDFERMRDAAYISAHGPTEAVMFFGSMLLLLASYGLTGLAEVVQLQHDRLNTR